VNPIARENLIRELEHLLNNKPPMGTLFMMVARTPHMLVATLDGDKISLAYPHSGRLDLVRRYRFASFCRGHGFPVRRELWNPVRVSRAVIGTDAAEAAHVINECFSSVYRLSGPYGLQLQGMGWVSATRPPA
jgi:hypothetical protein